MQPKTEQWSKAGIDRCGPEHSELLCLDISVMVLQVKTPVAKSQQQLSLHSYHIISYLSCPFRDLGWLDFTSIPWKSFKSFETHLF